MDSAMRESDGGMTENDATARDLLRGAIDLHMHTAPDIFPRSVNTYEAAVQAREAGMRAIVVKSHNVDTGSRAALVTELTGFPVYGGIALNYGVGGLNAHAVRESAWHGGREVWLPTIHARAFFANGASVPVLYDKIPIDRESGLVATEGGELLPETVDVLEEVVSGDLILSTGHLAPDEALIVLSAARSMGCERLVVTHPHAGFVGYTLDQMRQATQLGAVLEMHYAFTTPATEDETTVTDIAELVRELGPQHCILATDGGQSINPPPVELLRRFIAGFLAFGFGEDEIRLMTHETPARLLGLGG